MNAESGTRPRRRGAAPLVLTLAALLGLAILVVLLARAWQHRPRLTEESARELVVGALQRDSREAFVVTGALQLTVNTRARHTDRLLPGVLNITVGSAESRVRAPGRVSYGIAVAQLRAESIRLRGDTIELEVPPPSIYSVEPQLEDIEIQTERGWLRLGRDRRAQVQERALELVRSTLRAQAVQYLRDSQQPSIHTAETLHQLLRPVFQAAGFEDPVFLIRISDQLLYRGGEPARSAR